jgi:uncharacterized protein involved in exopolysaccharide biosynthesis
MDVDNAGRGGDLVAPKGKVSEAGLEYARALREVKYRETVQELFTRQYQMACVDEARQGAQVQIVDPAVAPDHPNSLYKVITFWAGLLLALPLALLIALACELLAILGDYRRRAGSWAVALEEAWAGAAR